MQSSNAPNKIQLPFAASGTKNTIPVPSQQGVTPGAASFTDGFPPLTFTPLSAGGVPPAGADFNGILNSITALQQWKSAGGQFPFDATFAAAIGGYPKGATVLRADGTGLWISTAENNTANPDTGGAGWLAFSASSVQSGSYNTASDTGTANAYAIALSPAPAALAAGMRVTIQNLVASNTGAATLNVNGLGSLPIQALKGAPLQGGELPSGCDAVLVLNAAANAWILVKCSNGSVAVLGATQPSHAIALWQPFMSSNSSSGSGTLSVLNSFTLACKGTLFTQGIGNGYGSPGTLTIAGASVAHINSGWANGGGGNLAVSTARSTLPAGGASITTTFTIGNSNGSAAIFNIFLPSA